MSNEDLSVITVAKLVDARGTACPGPLLEAKRAIGSCPVTGVMEILSSDEGTKADVARWCEKMQHEYLGDLAADGYWRVFLRRTK